MHKEFDQTPSSEENASLKSSSLQFWIHVPLLSRVSTLEGVSEEEEKVREEELASSFSHAAAIHHRCRWMTRGNGGIS